MIAVATFFVVLILSLIIVRVASVALSLTGLSREAARFQARSAWTGTGFTTAESESVVGHPVRRRIVSVLMVLRGAGLVTAASALMLSFAGARNSAADLERFAVLLVGLALIWLVSMSRWVDRWLTRAIRWWIGRYTDVDVRDFGSIMHLAGGYDIAEVHVSEDDWLAGRTLEDLRLPEEGLMVLGIQSADGEYHGAPRGRTEVEPGQTVIMYGRGDRIASLDQRRKDLAGEADRRSAMVAQHEQEAEDARRLEQERAEEGEQ
ncbi:MAG: TrkA C-terminal domain-containing protein [Phycisphaerales bacterium]